MKYLDDSAMIGFPSYLLVAVITSAIIIGIFSLSLLNVIDETKKDIVKNKIEKIISEAENMFEYADTGTLVNIRVEFPDALNFLVFGDISEEGLHVPIDTTLNEKTSNNYYYVFDDNSIESYSSHVRFSGKNIDEICILREGSYDLVLELEKNGGKTYVKIYQQ